MIAVAGELWITIFRSMRYPEGDAGCGRDHHALGQAADEFGAQQAVVQATRILREHRAAVLALTESDRTRQQGRPMMLVDGDMGGSAVQLTMQAPAAQQA